MAYIGTDKSLKQETNWADISKKVTDGMSQASSTIEAALHYIDKVTPDIKAVKAAGSRFSRYLGYAGFMLAMYDAAKKGMKPHHYVDAVIGISAMQIKDPRVALVVGLGLFISDAFFIHNTGKSTTEYIFD